MTETHLFQPSPQEIERRYANTRRAMAEHGLDALIVSGSEYTGFEGAVRYMCGFHILHRYAYVVVPARGEPVCVFPKEATWVGDHTATFIAEQVKVAHCGQWMAQHCRENGWQRIGVYGLEYIIPVRDYQALVDAGLEIVNFDVAFDHSRAQKSEEELLSVRRSMDINKAGVLAVIQAYAAGKTEAELMGVAEQVFTSLGTARNTMDMVLVGPNGSLLPQMVFPSVSRKVQDSDGLLFQGKGWRMGHVCGHSIGKTMIEHPRIGEGSEFELVENMICSMHPHVMTEDRTACLYFQETFRVGKDGGEPLSGIPVKFYQGGESSL